MERILELDNELFRAINGWHSPEWDTIMTTFSSVAVWIPLYLAMAVMLFFPYFYSRSSLAMGQGGKVQALPRKHFWKGAVVALLLCITCYLVCNTCADIVKHAVCRPRPNRVPELAMTGHFPSGMGGPYGFYSAHAANTFGFALLTGYIFRRRIWMVIGTLWALVISYSRIYLGYHFPGDVAVGLLVGLCAALLHIYIYKLAVSRIAARCVQ
ncbi:MAG: phosphatase PAP2 family protein [Bacteroidales bacterium]|nr:phosphatase PAP2 family protein [Bacteroidales bacterium]